MTDFSMLQSRKLAAVQFLQMAVAGKIEEAYQKYVDMQGKHHNPFFPGGFPALKKAQLDDYNQSPDKQITVVHVVGDGDIVAVHSHIVMNPGAKDFATVHIFRFEGEKVVEMWDFGQPAPADSPNQDGMF